jgi:hypothetical protein
MLAMLAMLSSISSMLSSFQHFIINLMEKDGAGSIVKKYVH